MAKAAVATSRTYPSSVGAPYEHRQAIIALLNARLADSFDLRSQVKWAHWNVKGLHFIQLHERGASCQRAAHRSAGSQ